MLCPVCIIFELVDDSDIALHPACPLIKDEPPADNVHGCVVDDLPP